MKQSIELLGSILSLWHFLLERTKFIKNIDSKILLRDTMKLIHDKGYEFGNADCTVCAEEPKLNPHIPLMQVCLAEVMAVDLDSISIKATTSERMGFVGRKEGITAYASVLIFKQ